MTEMPSPVLREDRDTVTVLTLNRARVLNAISDDLLDALDAHLDATESDPAIRALVFTGAGRAFCAGSDLGHRGDMSVRVVRMHRLIDRFRAFPKPTVAALNGLAFGGGLELALACDFRVAAPGIQVGLPEVKLGLIPLYGGTALLPRLIGESRALELMLGGDPIGAETALQWGLVNRLSAGGDNLLEAACTLARACSRHSALPTRALKRLLRPARAQDTLVEALAAEEREGLALTGSEDAQEGIAAFLEKRKAVFRDR
ncbi:MAG TPA: enoyl-CoA hydratase/isomerase family protein [Nevskiaceae bacterium]|nr:enoyl-CoA hydratase/isomerase family protein [Nevskiaceae bacterium]